MLLDTTHVGGKSIVVIVLENEHEQGYSDGRLAGAAVSRDRLQWEYPDAIDPSVGQVDGDPLHGGPLVTLPDNCKLRPAPAGTKVLRVGNATALVMIPNQE